MFECPGCGGNIVFDIASQKMRCEFCESQYDPYEVEESHEAQSSEMEVTTFICPQCGGSVYSANNSVAEFCSFCGASTILNSRITKEARPTKIIPFIVSKEACEQSYRKTIGRAIYAPKALRNDSVMDSFRGIYMPYWLYDVKLGKCCVPAEKSHRSGDYIITENFLVTGNMDAFYEDYPHDAAAGFSDDISERIMPYNMKEVKKFSSSFLSGFYADAADVDGKLYDEDARQFATEDAMNRVKRTSGFGAGLTYKEAKPSYFDAKISSRERVLLPVWFMAFRKDNRVSYATVNAQTGKVAAELPIEKKRVWIGTLLLMIPIFILLNMFVAMKASTTLVISGIAAAISLFAYLRESREIKVREKHEDDRGYLSFLNKNKGVAPKGTSEKAEVVAENLNAGFWKKMSLTGGYWVFPIVGMVVSILIYVFAPVDDLWYYGTSVFCFGMTLISCSDIISRMNRLLSRPLPQLGKRGEEPTAEGGANE